MDWVEVGGAGGAGCRFSNTLKNTFVQPFLIIANFLLTMY